MRAGKLNQLADIQRKTQFGTGTTGQPVFEWLTLTSNVPVGITTLAGRKLELSRQLVATATHEVILRDIDIEINDRLKWGDRLLNIGHLNPDDDITLTCTEQL